MGSDVPAGGQTSAVPEARPEHGLLGTWRVVSWEAQGTDGAVARPFGDHPIGYIVYTASGHFFAQLMRPGRPTFISGDLLAGTAEENASALSGYVAYGGTYVVEDGDVVHQVELSLFPNWTGGGQRRAIGWDRDRLTLSTPPVLAAGSTLIHRITWERVPPV